MSHVTARPDSSIGLAGTGRTPVVPWAGRCSLWSGACREPISVASRFLLVVVHDSDVIKSGGGPAGMVTGEAEDHGGVVDVLTGLDVVIPAVDEIQGPGRQRRRVHRVARHGSSAEEMPPVGQPQ